MQPTGEGWATSQDVRDANLARLTWLLDTGEQPTYRCYALKGASPEGDHARLELGVDCLPMASPPIWVSASSARPGARSLHHVSQPHPG